MTAALIPPRIALRAWPTWLCACAVVGCVLAAGCATTTQSGAVGADRQQFLLISSGDLEQMAAKSYAQLTSQAARKGALNADPALTARVRGIANRLIAQTKIFRPDAANWRWEVNVIQSKELNAFCMPGGKIAVYSGLITQLKLTDDEIAVVIGHEIAHALREHSREQVSQAIAAQAAIGIGAALLGMQGAGDVVSMGYQALGATKFSRVHESEADRIGLELTARAGFDPRAGVTLWRKMLAAEKGGSIELLSSHPSGQSRIQEIESLLPVVMPLYEQAHGKR
ncbi:MAG: M48 family metallopeptidase [Burkholderiales bacterium]